MSKYLRLIFFYVVFIISIKIVWGQQYNIKNYSIKHGLPNSMVKALYQDELGYIWFGTQNGLCYFDGTEFNTFDQLKSISGIDIVGITQSKDSTIWVAVHGKGILLYKNKKFSWLNKSFGLNNLQVQSIYKDEEGIIWVATKGGLFYWNDSHFKEIIDPLKKLRKGVFTILKSKKNELWIGTIGNGLIHKSKDEFRYYTSKDGLLDDYIFSLTFDQDTLLIGTTISGVVKFFNGQFKPLNIPEISRSWISNIIVSNKKKLIISSSGLVQLDKESYKIITMSNGLPTDDLLQGDLDFNENLWLATSNGVSCLRKEDFLTFNESNGLPNHKIHSISLINNQLIAGTDGGGINIVMNNKFHSNVNFNETSNLKITDILFLKEKNELWLGGDLSNNGIIILEERNKKFRVKNKINILKNSPLSTVTKLSIDDQNNIWIASYGAGVFKISKNDTIHYSIKNHLPSNDILTMYIDKKNNVWISIYQKGVWCFDGKKWRSFSSERSLEDKIVWAINEDLNGNILFGCGTSGLLIYNGKQISSISSKNGLLSDLIQAITVDENNTIWAGSEKGLNKIILNTNLTAKIIETYNDKNGLSNEEINQNALIYQDGILWIGTTSGLTRFDTKTNHIPSKQPSLVLKNVLLFFDEINWKSINNENIDFRTSLPTKIDLPYNKNHLTFSFNALSINTCYYSYNLEGNDDKWSPWSEVNEIVFSNLPPGNYILKIKAKDMYGLISKNNIKIPINISPPIWQTLWFRLVSILVILILVFILFKWRTKSLLERQKHLEKIVEERTEEVVAQKNTLEKQKLIVEHKQKEILDSINYAKRIQQAILPPEKEFKQNLPESFILYKPKDIVAGDFYWMDASKDAVYFAAADCTGHGVPGAMVSVVCNNALNRSVREFGLSNPGKILDKTREIVIQEFEKSDDEVKDGMDISLCVIHKEKLLWAGANNPLWIIRKSSNEVQEIKADKQPIGKYIDHLPFTTHNIDLTIVDSIYIFTDGYQDQFGGLKGKKFKSAQLKEVLLSIKDLKMEEQLLVIDQTFENWKGENEQVDDVCIIGVKI